MTDEKSAYPGLDTVIQSAISMVWGMSHSPKDEAVIEQAKAAVRAPLRFVVDRGPVGRVVAAQTGAVLVGIDSTNELMATLFGDDLRFVVARDELQQFVAHANQIKRQILALLDQLVGGDFVGADVHPLFPSIPAGVITSIVVTDMQNVRLLELPPDVDRDAIIAAVVAAQLSPGTYRAWALDDTGKWMPGFYRFAYTAETTEVIQ